MIKFIAIALGSVLTYLPKFIPSTLAWAGGGVLYYLPTSRRRMLLSNFHHAFPEKTEALRRRMARRSCSRLFEMGMFVLVSPFYSQKRIQEMLAFTDSAKEYFNVDHKKAQLLLLPHFSLTESISLCRACREASKDKQEVGIIFRPLDNPAADAWVKKTRERWGVRLLSRKEGFKEAGEILKRNGRVGILFDQNAGMPGVLDTFFGRLASSTPLPDLLAKKQGGVDAYVVYTQRTGFWKGTLDIQKLPDSPVTPIRVSANRFLESKLREGDSVCADWLWFHGRWNAQTADWLRYQLRQKKMDLDVSELRSKTRFWFRMPNWLGDVIMAIPLLRAIRRGRPDGEITLLVQKHFIPLLEKLDIADRLIPLPAKDWKYFFRMWALRGEYPDCQFMFTNSERGDMEARIINAPQRFGMLRQGKKRSLLTHVWEMHPEFDEKCNHQTHTWGYCLRRFGLVEEADYSPLRIASSMEGALSIGLICGTENDPKKRWSVERWRELVGELLIRYPGVRIKLFGTARDGIITAQVAEGFSEVVDLAGKTGLVEFAAELQASSFIVCNDTGGMHLANALGVAVIGIFGPTNPVRTGPIFEAPKTILQPEGCPVTGGAPIEDVTVAAVLDAVKERLEKGAPRPLDPRQDLDPEPVSF